ncbi:MAG TPA: VanW family protein [Aggregatilineaceae bacterium]|nr:VanW family protein [Aggregatilineaceae bacterium]
MNAPNLPYRRQPSPYSQPPATTYQQRLNPWVVRLTLLFLSGLILLFFVLMIMVAGYEFLHRDEINPGVSTILDLNLAGMSRQEAIAALSNQFTYADQATFAFRYGDQSWEFTASELGVSLDKEATVNAAYSAGRDGSRVENLLTQLDIRFNGYPVAPVITYNQARAERRLTDIANAYINRPVVDATLTIRDGKATALPSQVGRSVDIGATLSVLRKEILGLSTHSEITLVVNETPPTVWDATQAAERANLALSAPVEFYTRPEDDMDQGPWVAQIPSLQDMLSINLVTHDDGTADYEVNLDLDQPRAFLNELAPDLTIQPVDARFTFNDETRQLDVIENSVSGRALDIESTVAQFETAVFAQNRAQRRVALVFQTVPPTIPDTATAAQLGITEKVVQKTTYFHGSTAARQRNIQVAASRFHGLVIAPGAIFSFNEWLGDVSPETGYEQGLIIVGNQTITGVGGGVCQVATTAFQTAFYGGYPILERVEHAYRVGYYEEGEGSGMDATVYAPIVDFRFKNDTPYYLLIETYVNVNNSTVTWKFYSTSMNRRVVKDGPYIRNQTGAPPPIYHANPALASGQIRQIDYAVSGADVYVYRTVYQDDRVIIDHEEFHSHYVPWADQYEVAPGDPRING